MAGRGTRASGLVILNWEDGVRKESRKRKKTEREKKKKKKKREGERDTAREGLPFRSICESGGEIFFSAFFFFSPLL